MTYKFKYHPDNTIYQNGVYIGDYEHFINQNPDFPITEGKYFEYQGDGILQLINDKKHHINVKDLTPYQDLIIAINNLGD